MKDDDRYESKGKWGEPHSNREILCTKRDGLDPQRDGLHPILIQDWLINGSGEMIIPLLKGVIFYVQMGAYSYEC